MEDKKEVVRVSVAKYREKSKTLGLVRVEAQVTQDIYVKINRLVDDYGITTSQAVNLLCDNSNIEDVDLKINSIVDTYAITNSMSLVGNKLFGASVDGSGLLRSSTVQNGNAKKAIADFFNNKTTIGIGENDDKQK